MKRNIKIRFNRWTGVVQQRRTEHYGLKYDSSPPTHTHPCRSTLNKGNVGIVFFFFLIYLNRGRMGKKETVTITGSAFTEACLNSPNSQHSVLCLLLFVSNEIKHVTTQINKRKAITVVGIIPKRVCSLRPRLVLRNGGLRSPWVSQMSWSWQGALVAPWWEIGLRERTTTDFKTTSGSLLMCAWKQRTVLKEYQTPLLELVQPLSDQTQKCFYYIRIVQVHKSTILMLGNSTAT